jgi:uncharacterized iron-regulated membrane protein
VADRLLPALQPIPLHLGALHAWEQALTLALAFGPFLLLGGVIWWRQRHESPEESDDRSDQPAR